MVRFQRVAALVLACIAGNACLAQPPQPAAPASQKVWRPGEVHSGNTRIYVHVFKTGMGHEHAVAGLVKEGEIHLGAVQNAGYVVADLASFAADVPYARKLLGLAGESDADTQKKVNANMHGADVLDVARFPTAMGKIDSARLLPERTREGALQYLLDGSLTFHGVTKKMSVVVEAAEQNGWIRLRGHVSLKQTDFGIRPFTAMMGALGVADQVEIYGEGYIVKE